MTDKNDVYLEILQSCGRNLFAAIEINFLYVRTVVGNTEDGLVCDVVHPRQHNEGEVLTTPADGTHTCICYLCRCKHSKVDNSY